MAAGDKLFIVGQDADNVDEYALTTPFDISTASHSVSFGVGSQDANHAGIFFRADGNKFYTVGWGNDNVYEYNTGSAWDITLASFQQSFSVGGQDTSPSGVTFSPDGTKMYVSGFTGKDINEYDLSTPWDISTATFNQAFSVSTQDTAPQDVRFKPDGTKMYVAGDSSDSILEYDLSTPWDVSTASFNQSFSVVTQDNSPLALYFNFDGDKMYVGGSQNDNVYEYDLSTPWDVSTATFNQSFGIGTQQTTITGVFLETEQIYEDTLTDDVAYTDATGFLYADTLLDDTALGDFAEYLANQLAGQDPKLHWVAEPSVTPDMVNFTRGSSAYTTDNTGTLVSKGNNVLRDWWNPETLDYEGKLIEQGSTNEIVQSNNQTDAIYATGGANWTVTANNANAPDGNLDADHLSLDNLTSSHPYYTNVAVTDNTDQNVFSLFVKPDTATHCRLQHAFIGGTNVNAEVRVDFGAETAVVSGSADAAGIEKYPNGWYRIWCVTTNNGLGNTTARLSIIWADGSWAHSADTGWTWGWQYEKLKSAPSSLMVTTGSTFTRSDDVLSIDLSTYLENHTLDTEGALFLDFIPRFNLEQGASDLLSINDNTANEAHNLTLDGSGVLNFETFDGGVSQAALSIAGDISDRGRHKAAAWWKASDFGLTRDGQTSDVDATGTVPAGLTDLDLFHNLGTITFQGTFRQLALFESIDVDATWESLTDPSDPTNLDDVALAETVAGFQLYDDTLVGPLTLGDPVGSQLTVPRTVLDTVSYTEDLFFQFNRTLLDNAFIWDTPKVGWKKEILDDVTLTETLLGKLTVPVIDYITLVENLSIAGNYSVLESDQFNLLDNPNIFQKFLDILAETLTLADIILDEHQMRHLAKDILSLFDSAPNTGTFAQIALDSLIVKDVIDRAFSSLLLDSLTLSDLANTTLALTLKLTDDVAYVDTEAVLAKLLHILKDDVTLLDDPTTQATLVSLLEEGIVLETEITISGDTYICWVLTGQTFEGSIYGNFDFNSFAHDGDFLYGAKSDGVYRFDADTDDGAEVLTGVVLDLDNMESTAVKRLRSVYLGTELSTKATLEVSSDRGNKGSFQINKKRFPVSKDVIGKRFVFKVERLDDLENIQIMLYSLSKMR